MQPSEQIRFWAHELAAMARTGLQFATNDYDRDRFQRMLTIGGDMAAMTIDAEFTPERPYLADDPLPYGLEVNRNGFEMLVRFAREQKVTASAPPLEDLFVAVDERGVS